MGPTHVTHLGSSSCILHHTCIFNLFQKLQFYIVSHIPVSVLISSGGHNRSLDHNMFWGLLKIFANYLRFFPRPKVLLKKRKEKKRNWFPCLIWICLAVLTFFPILCSDCRDLMAATFERSFKSFSLLIFLFGGT